MKTQTLPTGLETENGRIALVSPVIAVGGVQISISLWRVAGGIVSCPQTLTSDVALVDEKGMPLPGVNLRDALHAAADATIDRLEQMQRGEV